MVLSGCGSIKNGELQKNLPCETGRRTKHQPNTSSASERGPDSGGISGTIALCQMPILENSDAQNRNWPKSFIAIPDTINLV
jgi:hypothetical protein